MISLMHKYFVLLFIISSFGLFLKFASRTKGLQDTEEKYPVFLNEQLPATLVAGSLPPEVERSKLSVGRFFCFRTAAFQHDAQ